MNKLALVREFHKAFNLPVATTDFFNMEQMLFRHKLTMDELCREGYEALVRRDQAAYFDSMVDTLYFIYGTAVELGWDIDEAFARVHKANMDKLGSDGLARFRTDGKVIKPEGWTAPNLGDLVK